MSNPVKTLGLGMIGCGGFAEFTLGIFADMPELRIAALTDRNAARAEQMAQRYHAPVLADDMAVIGDPSVDLVVIATPPAFHGPQTLAALRAGKHVFVEKPLATSLDEANAILEALRQAPQLRLGINYILRWVPLYDTLRALVASDLLGGITYMSLENHASNEALGDEHWFWDRSLSGGIFVEHGVHFFDLCNNLVGTPTRRVEAVAHQSGHRQDRVLSTVEYANGTLASFYHGFDRRAVIERTTLHLTFERGQVMAYGWIPDRLEVECMALGDVEEFSRSLSAVLGAAVETVHAPAPPGVPGGTAGVLARATVTRPDRTADYGHGVRAGIADLVRAILDPAHLMRVPPQDAYNSVKLALDSQAALQT
jgi:predicted dehydrogenase